VNSTKWWSELRHLVPFNAFLSVLTLLQAIEIQAQRAPAKTRLTTLMFVRANFLSISACNGSPFVIRDSLVGNNIIRRRSLAPKNKRLIGVSLCLDSGGASRFRYLVPGLEGWQVQ